ncbi:hypothetical protein CHCC5027_0851 [Bacillus paralicheniformis]|nr:hypothetical protein CHCC5027_0851 [Bacillus paralicheniformis]
MSYLLQAPGYWTGVTGALRYFGDENLLKLLEDTKQVIEINGHNADTMNELYERFQGIVSGSLKRISSFIRSNPQDFVILAK